MGNPSSLRFFSQAFGAAVHFDDRTYAITISTGTARTYVLGYYYSYSYEDFCQNYRSLSGVAAVIFAVRHSEYLQLEPDEVVRAAGGPIAVVDCFGILDDTRITRYLELGCEVKALGRGHIKRLKEAVDRPIWIKANAGLPEVVGGRTVYELV